MPRVAILDDYQDVARTMADWTSLPPGFEVTVFNDHVSEPAALARRLADFEVVCIMRERTPFPRAVFAQLPKLGLLVTTGMRNLSVDMAAAAAHGVTVCGTRGTTPPTPELAMGLILALARHIPFEHQAMRQGRWQTTIGRSLHGATLGLLGVGRLGSYVAKLGKAFGMEAIGWSQNLTAEKAAEQGVRRVDRDELFASADFLSIHLVLGDRSRGLVGAADFARMKPTAYLVNTSRGPIVQQDALIAALTERRIAGAGLDVYDTEPLPADHPLRRLDNVVLTPHLGYVTDDTYRLFYADTVECVAAWAKGAPVRVITD
ncbi:MAG: D-2-hydroxyacid dehydrogenase family protein [Alphaproteobacteria bacterium]